METEVIVGTHYYATMGTQVILGTHNNGTETTVGI
jgi:hypothetical protein